MKLIQNVRGHLILFDNSEGRLDFCTMANVLKIVPFDHAEKKYDIVVTSNGGTITIRTYNDDGTSANGFSHSVSFPVARGLKKVRGVEAVAELIEDAKRDITEKRWERALKLWAEAQ